MAQRAARWRNERRAELWSAVWRVADRSSQLLTRGARELSQQESSRAARRGGRKHAMRAHRVVFLAAVTFLVFYHLQRWRWRSKPRVAVAQSRFAPAEALHDATPPPSPPPPSLTGYPPKNCSMLLFRHLAKSGGSTVQSMLRRNEQTGDLYYASWGTWVEVRPPEWNVLFREMSGDPEGIQGRV